ncbi:hypothetical protein SmJEL517_g00968 [Synchytrium microbalum]|uniref:Uncharacterized protein n=1 Tax=Synchytrium microbalum TaxID=1806994 RepID=A0A507C689_9FUNG|nr:uncharacterized protein SmJEL517_g00968 [Synchytrium microbalum]TPX37110.1 hypothetical protein SmJEL517_g00968 [Synchytrium microbalum]
MFRGYKGGRTALIDSSSNNQWYTDHRNEAVVEQDDSDDEPDFQHDDDEEDFPKFRDWTAETPAMSRKLDHHVVNGRDLSPRLPPISSIPPSFEPPASNNYNVSSSPSLDFDTELSRSQSLVDSKTHHQDHHIQPPVRKVEAYAIADQSRAFGNYIPNMTPTFSDFVTHDDLDALLASFQNTTPAVVNGDSGISSNTSRSPRNGGGTSSSRSPRNGRSPLHSPRISPRSSPRVGHVSPMESLLAPPRAKPTFQFATIDDLPNVNETVAVESSTSGRRYDSAINLYGSSAELSTFKKSNSLLVENVEDDGILAEKAEEEAEEKRPLLADFKSLNDLMSRDMDAIAPVSESVPASASPTLDLPENPSPSEQQPGRLKKSQKKKKKKKFKVRKPKAANSGNRNAGEADSDGDDVEGQEEEEGGDEDDEEGDANMDSFEQDGRPPIARQGPSPTSSQIPFSSSSSKSPKSNNRPSAPNSKTQSPHHQPKSKSPHHIDILPPANISKSSSASSSKPSQQHQPHQSQPPSTLKIQHNRLSIKVHPDSKDSAPPLSAPPSTVANNLPIPTNTILSANDVETCETILLTTSELVPSSLYGVILDTLVNKLGYEVESLSRRCVRPWASQPKDRRDIVTRATLAIVVSRRNDTISVPLTLEAGLSEIHTRCLDVLNEPGFSYSSSNNNSTSTKALLNSTPSHIISTARAPKRDKTRKDLDVLSALLPPPSPQNRIGQQNVVNTCIEVPQIVFVMARMHIAIPLLRKLIEPSIPSSTTRPPVSASGVQYVSSNRFELLGIKCIPCITPAHAKLLTPFEVHERQWASSLEVLTSSGGGNGGEQRWMVLALRRIGAYDYLEKITSSLIESHKPPAGNNLIKTSAVVGLSDKDLARLSILSTSSPDMALQALTSFFRDVELLPGDPSEWEDVACHPIEYFSHPVVLQNVTLAAPLLMSAVIMDKRMFPSLGKVLARIQREGFVLTGLKLCRISANMAQKFVANADDQERLTPTQRDDFMRKLTDGPVLCGLISRENGVRKWLDVLDDVYLKSGGLPLQVGDALPDPMPFGLYGSPSFRAALNQKQVLFPEGPPVDALSHICMNRYMRKIVPKAPTDLPPPGRKCYSFLTPRGPNASPSGEAQLSCVLLLPVETTFEKILAQWAKIVDCILGTTPPTSATATSTASGGSSAASSSRPPRPQESQQQQQQRGRASRGGERERGRIRETSSSTRASDDTVQDDDEQQQPFKLIACRLVIVRENVAEEVAKWSAISNAEWGAVGAGVPVEMTMRNGPTLILALEKEGGSAPAMLNSKIERLDKSLGKCIIATQSHDEALKVLPDFFGDLHGSTLYRIKT